MRALVTGSAGFLGRHFAAALGGGGWEVYGCDLAAGQAMAAAVEYRDARDLFRRGTARFDLVVHCAAVEPNRLANDTRPLALTANLELDAALFAWAARTRPGRVLYLSSPAAYPVGLQREPGRRLYEDDIWPDAPEVPDGMYGWVKLTGERVAAAARAEGVPVTVVRPFSGYGAGQSVDYPFGAFLARARAREDPFLIWGDGSQVRDWIHVTDVAAAALAVAGAGEPGPVNLGTGQGHSMLDVARIMCDLAGYQPRFDTRPGALAGVAYRVADPARMLRWYAPKVTLAAGIAGALQEGSR